MNYQKYSKYSLKEIARIKNSGAKPQLATRPSMLKPVAVHKPKEEDAPKGMNATQYVNLLEDATLATTNFEAAFVLPILHYIQDSYPELSPKEVVAKFEAWRVGGKKFSPDNVKDCFVESMNTSSEGYGDFCDRCHEQSKAKKNWKYHTEWECICERTDKEYTKHYFGMWHKNLQQWEANKMGMIYLLFVVTKNTGVLTNNIYHAYEAAHTAQRYVPQWGACISRCPNFTFQEFILAARWLDKQVKERPEFKDAGTFDTDEFSKCFGQYIMPLIKEQTDTVI